MEIKDRQTLSEYISEETKCYSGGGITCNRGERFAKAYYFVKKSRIPYQ